MGTPCHQLLGRAVCLGLPPRITVGGGGLAKGVCGRARPPRSGYASVTYRNPGLALQGALLCSDSDPWAVGSHGCSGPEFQASRALLRGRLWATSTGHPEASFFWAPPTRCLLPSGATRAGGCMSQTMSLLWKYARSTRQAPPFLGSRGSGGSQEPREPIPLKCILCHQIHHSKRPWWQR